MIGISLLEASSKSQEVFFTDTLIIRLTSKIIATIIGHLEFREIT